MRVLILGAGGAAAIGYTRALRLADASYYLIGADTSRDALHFAETDEAHHVENDTELVGLLVSTRPDFVHAQPDEEVLRLSRLRATLKWHGVRFFLPSHHAIVTCQDKWESYLRWKEAGVPVPHTQLVRGREALYNTITARGRECWLRRRSGAGGAGSVRTDSFDFACHWMQRNDGWGEFTVADVLPGKSVTWTSVWWKGEFVASQQRLRLSWANGRNAPSGVSGSTGVGETCSDPRVEEVAPAACRAIDARPHGIWSVDMTYDDFGMPNPTEVNPGRWFTTVPEFFARAGFNIAHQYTRIGGEGEFYASEWDDGDSFNPLPDGLRWHRLMDTQPRLEDRSGEGRRIEGARLVQREAGPVAEQVG